MGKAVSKKCEWCNGEYHVCAKGGITTLWMMGNHLGVSGIYEDNTFTIPMCPYCGGKPVELTNDEVFAKLKEAQNGGRS